MGVLENFANTFLVIIKLRQGQQFAGLIMAWKGIAKFLRTPIFLVVLVLSATLPGFDCRPQNILLIMYEDLRVDLPFYGRKHVIAPNLQRLGI